MLDDRDRKILSLLQADAETPLGELAESVALSPSACSRRIARLKEEGYIGRMTAELDRNGGRLSAAVLAVVRSPQFRTVRGRDFEESP